ncbi:hypothetical protein JX265_007979 [Neoarthrinium moseri]|uniref:Prion-inhibition and propagation HeLo domain-containing protein n=1 Tax=Neoarthrinium moseri TaxID=1658444 RepID=A0A9P9WIZ7_9PEZI|nr:hypothetical protein JX265_007979 [Neoarthrinium moseri]
MAEAAGLAVGTIALASLFQTCVDILDYIEDARNIESDRDRGDTRLGLLKIRLKQWGDKLQVANPGYEDGGLIDHWDGESDTISKSLLGIKGILEQASYLSHKYAPYKMAISAWPCDSNLSRKATETENQDVRRKTAYQKFLYLKQRATWALRDKRRFNASLVELDFFITNLEIVTSRLLALEKLDWESLTVNETDFTMSKTTTLNDITKGESALGKILDNRGPPRPAVIKLPADKISEPTRTKDGHKFTNMISKDKAMQVEGDHGNADPNAKRHEYQSHQAEDASTQIMGNLDRIASDNVFGLLQQRVASNSKPQK